MKPNLEKLFSEEPLGPWMYEEQRKRGLFVEIGQLLAQKGVVVVTNGYGEVSDDVSRGACEGGGEAIGYTLGTLVEKKSSSFLTRTVDCATEAGKILENNSGIEPHSHDLKCLAFYLQRYYLSLSQGFICAPPSWVDKFEEPLSVMKMNEKFGALKPLAVFPTRCQTHGPVFDLKMNHKHKENRMNMYVQTASQAVSWVLLSRQDDIIS